MRFASLIIAILTFIVAIIWMIVAPGFEPVLAFLAGIAALLAYLGREQSKEEGETLDQRNRRIMLNHVENFWVQGILEKSLHGAALLELGIREDPSVISYPWAIKKEITNETLSAGKSIREIFQEIGMGRSLLILGAPGSGKTTMLLELARQLIEYAREDVTEPIPVVFNLSSWTERLTLADWLARELNVIYMIPKKTAPIWIKENKITLLLDGLDEVRQENRNNCVEAINQFRKESGLISMAVCSRTQDYAQLKTLLSFEGAVEIQPLTPGQIGDYFKRFGKGRAGIRQVLERDTALSEMAQTPLFLSIMTLAYRDMRSKDILLSDDADIQRTHLFDTYIARMFERPNRSRNASFQKQNVLRWLSWLAQKMIERKLSIFFLEQLYLVVDPPETLAHKRMHRFVQLFISLVFGLIVGLLFGLIDGIKTGFVAVLIGGLVYWKVQQGAVMPINKPTELMKWSNKKAWNSMTHQPGRQTLFNVAILAPLFGALAGWFISETVTGIINGAIFGFLISVMGALLINGVILGLYPMDLETKTTPNQGTWRSLKNAVVVFLIGELVMIMFFMLSSIAFGMLLDMPFSWSWLRGGLLFGLLAGLFFGLLYGGHAVAYHCILRFLLHRNNLVPWQLIPFLDYSVNCIFLRRVGGGYIFVHRLLMEHFAEMNV